MIWWLVVGLTVAIAAVTIVSTPPKTKAPPRDDLRIVYHPEGPKAAETHLAARQREAKARVDQEYRDMMKALYERKWAMERAHAAALNEAAIQKRIRAWKEGNPQG